MKIDQMHISFKQGLDKFDSKNYPNIEPEEIDLLLFDLDNINYSNGLQLSTGVKTAFWDSVGASATEPLIDIFIKKRKK